MADIFISYRSLRQPAVRHLKRVLEAHGYSVWFDYGLLSGEEFAPVIERELRDAKAAIVIWCKHSKDSHWVREEADLALSLGNYLPVLLDPIDPPFGFRRIDTVNLSAWDGDPRGPGLDRLLEQISQKTARDPAPQYKRLVDLQQIWRDTGKIAWAALPLDEKLAAQIEAKRKAGEGLGRQVATPGGAVTAQAAPVAQALEAARRALEAGIAAAKVQPETGPTLSHETPFERLWVKAAMRGDAALQPQPAAAGATAAGGDAGNGPAGTGEKALAENVSDRLPKWLLPAGVAVMVAALLLFWSPWRNREKIDEAAQIEAAAPAEAAPAAIAAPAADLAALPDTRPPPSTRAAGLVARAGIVLKGHGAAVTSAAFSPDGAKVVTASWDKTARIWRVSDGALLATLTGHGSLLNSAAFSPDGAKVVTASADSTARIWRAADGALLATLTGHEDYVYSAAFSPDRAKVVTASWDKTARIWRAADGALLATLEGHGDEVTSAAFSPDGAKVVTASSDKTARLWRAADGALLATLEGHRGYVLSAAFSPDGAKVVTASQDNTARIWRVSDGALLATLTGHGDAVTSAAFSPDGTKVVTASRDSTARIWRVTDGALLATLTGHEGYVRSAAFSPDGAKVVTASSDKTARIWELGKP